MREVVAIMPNRPDYAVPRLKRNAAGWYEIRWSEKDPVRGVWRSHRKSARTKDKGVALSELQDFIDKRKGGGTAASTLTVSALIDAYELAGRARDIADTQLFALRPVRLFFGSMLPKDITPHVVSEYVVRRHGGEFTVRGVDASGPTIRRELSALAAVLNWAAKTRLIPKADVPFIDLPSPSLPREVFLSQLEADELWGHAQTWKRDKTGLFTMIALDTWARADAIETLPWGRVRHGSPWLIDYRDPTRRATIKRRVPVPVSPRLQQVLEGIVSEHTRTDELVTGPVSYRDWRRFIEASPLTKDITRHDLRRTGISLALARGVDPVKVAQMAGDDLATIMKHYAHFMPDYLSGVHEKPTPQAVVSPDNASAASSASSCNAGRTGLSWLVHATDPPPEPIM